jgi:hypothetical protein
MRTEFVVVDLSVVKLLLQIRASEINCRPELFEVGLLLPLALALQVRRGWLVQPELDAVLH